MFTLNLINRFKISLPLLFLFSLSAQCAQQTSLMDLPNDILDHHIMPTLEMLSNNEKPGMLGNVRAIFGISKKLAPCPQALNFVNIRMYLLYKEKQPLSLTDLPSNILDNHIIPRLETIHSRPGIFWGTITEFSQITCKAMNCLNKKMYLLSLNKKSDKNIISEVKNWSLLELKNNLQPMDEKMSLEFKTSFKRAFLNLSNEKSIKNNFIKDKMTSLVIIALCSGISFTANQFLIHPFECEQNPCIGNYFISAWNIPTALTTLFSGFSALAFGLELFNPLNSTTPLLDYDSSFGQMMLSDYLWLWYLNRQL